jgi:hypothetical protein
MPVMMQNLYEALRAANVPEDKAQAAAVEAASKVDVSNAKHFATKSDIADIRADIARMRTDIANSRPKPLRWVIGAVVLNAMVIVGVMFGLAKFLSPR